MGKGIDSNQFKECIAKGKIRKFNVAKGLVSKELKTSKEDLNTALESFRRESYKWATVQAYYSMFHSARALIYSKGYRERSHYCLIVAIRALFVAEGKLSDKLVEALQTGKVLRENADYQSESSKTSAKALLDKAEELLKYTEQILESNRE